MKLKIGIICILLLFTAINSLIGQSVGPEKSLSIAWDSVRAADGKTYVVQLGKVQVPENRDHPQSNAITINFVRFKTSSASPLPPIFIFDGGPGDAPSTIQNLNQLAPVFSMFTQQSDVVIVEQRGNGTNTPNLTCPGYYNLPLDTALSAAGSLVHYRNYVKKCSDFWKAREVDFSGYQVLAMAADIEAVRRQLEYPKLMLFGGSFGSHHALTYLKKYEHSVDRVLLTLPEGLNHTVKYPYEVDKVLEQLSKLAADHHPHFKHSTSLLNLADSIMNELQQNPVEAITRHPVTGEDVEITLGKYDLQLATALELGRIGYRALPNYYLQMKSGDFSWLANYAINLRINQRHNLMAILTDCASGATAERWLMVRQQAKDAMLADALNDINFGACDLLDFWDIGDHERMEFYSEVPMLVIYGSQDARTPVRNANELRPFFSQANFLEVKYASHDLFQEGFELLAPYLIGYLSAPDPTLFEIPESLEVPLNLKQ